MRTSKCALALVVIVLMSFSMGANRRRALPPLNSWTASLEEAQQRAQDLKMPILICFLGSDWCPYCIDLVKEVLNTGSFAQWASQNVIVLVADFPEHKQLPPFVKERNEALKKRFKANGFPTTVLVSAEGKVVGRLSGYSGKEKWEKDLINAVAKANSPNADTEKPKAKSKKKKKAQTT